MKKAFPWLRKRADPETYGVEVIRGEKVIIREKRLDDAPNDYAWRTDEELARLDATRPLRMSYQEFLRISKEELLYTSPSSKRLAIDTFEGRHIGNCMYYDVDVRRGEAELGIMIGDRDYWSKGYGTDSVDRLLDHIFSTTSLGLVYLHTLVWNKRARLSFAKSGFKDVSTVRRGGMEFMRMEVASEEWKENHDSKGLTSVPSGTTSPDDATSIDGAGPAARAE